MALAYQHANRRSLRTSGTFALENSNVPNQTSGQFSNCINPICSLYSFILKPKGFVIREKSGFSSFKRLKVIKPKRSWCLKPLMQVQTFPEHHYVFISSSCYNSSSSRLFALALALALPCAAQSHSPRGTSEEQ